MYTTTARHGNIRLKLFLMFQKMGWTPFLRLYRLRLQIFRYAFLIKRENIQSRCEAGT